MLTNRVAALEPGQGQYTLMLNEAGGVKKKAARLLGISFRSYRYRLEKLGVEDASRAD